MKRLVLGAALLLLIFISRCTPDPIQPLASLIKIYCSPVSKDTLGNVRLTTQKLFYAQIIYFRSNINDSAYAQPKPNSFINFDSSYRDGITRIDSSYIPNGYYNRLSFGYFRPVADSLAADSVKALFELAGYIDTTPFLFRSAPKFTLYFPDSLLEVPKGKVINLLFSIDLNKALNPQLGGVDISTAVDGNDDGYILIDPKNNDGNATLAAQLLSSIVKNASIKSQ